MKNKFFKSPWLSIFLVVAVLATGGAVYQFMNAQHYRREMTNQYNRAFYELVESMENVEVSLEKGMLVSNSGQMVRLSNEVNRKTQSAKTSLAQLPFEKTHIDKISTFLTQAGDFTYYLAMKMAREEKLNEQDYQGVQQLIQYSKMLNESIEQAQAEVYSGKMSVSNMSSAFGKDMQTLDISMGDLEKQFVEYPALVYDGPFSSHVDSLMPKLTDGKPELSQEEAVQKAKWFLNSGSGRVEVAGEVGGNLPAYSITCWPDENDQMYTVNLEVTKAGGYVVWYLDNREIGGATAGVEEAKRTAAEYLVNKGYNSMKDTYYEVRDNIATINYAYVQGDTMMYPDLIKVKVALDTCKVVGLEAKGYIMSHQDSRSIAAPGVTKDKIMAKVPAALQVNSVSMAVIPGDDLKEIYCYEIKGSADGRNFLLYFDAKTGLETKILMLIEDETGILSM